MGTQNEIAADGGCEWTVAENGRVQWVTLGVTPETRQRDYANGSYRPAASRASQAYARLRQLRGKVYFSRDAAELKADR